MAQSPGARFLPADYCCTTCIVSSMANVGQSVFCRIGGRGGDFEMLAVVNSQRVTIAAAGPVATPWRLPVEADPSLRRIRGLP